MLNSDNRQQHEMEQMAGEVASPCQQVCQINTETGYCIGCLRTLDEIADWLEMSNEEKRNVLDQVEQRREAAA